MDLLLQVLFWCPKCWRTAGRWLFIASCTLMLLGWRLAGRADRIDERAGIKVDLGKVLESIPLPVPSTAEEFTFAAFCACLGFGLALTGKWAQKF